MSEEKYKETYKLMNDGAFNDIYYSNDSYGKTVQISAKKLRKYCENEDIDFDDFLKYAQERKAEENN